VSVARGERNVAVRSGLVVVVAAALYVGLGLRVSHAAPSGYDAVARAFAGEFQRVAWVFTASCLWPTLTLFGLAGCVIAWRVRVWRGRIVFAISTTLIGWQVSDELKTAFARPRPAYWVLHHETTYAYSSGHAFFATLVYWLWAYHVARNGPRGPSRVLGTLVLAIWGAGVLWSRLALGAHYPSDLVGGVLLGIAMLALAHLVATLTVPHVRVL
jgi:membrane-associated phospholipid phosphatase